MQIDVNEETQNKLYTTSSILVKISSSRFWGFPVHWQDSQNGYAR